MTVLDDSAIRRIASWEPAPAVTSLYLDVDGLRHPRWSDVEGRADHLFRSARQLAHHNAPGTEGEVDADLAQMRTWLGSGLDRSVVRGVALFASAAAGSFEAVELAAPVRDQVAVDPEPDVAQLCFVAATAWSALGVWVDRSRWRVVVVGSDGHAEELDVLDDDVPRNVDTDVELAGFERHEDELVREHLRRVARAVSAHMGRAPARRLVLMGAAETLDELERHLPHRVAANLAGRAAVTGHVGTSDLVATVRRVVEGRADHERAEVLRTLRQRATTTRSFVAIGLDAVLDALGSEQVATLVVERAFEAPGGRCRDCRLLVAGGEVRCPRCSGSVLPLGNVVDAAIVDAYLHHGALVPVAQGALDDLGHIGARLRPWHRTSEAGEPHA